MKTTLQLFFARHKLDQTERAFFDTVCAIFRDPELAQYRARLRSGDLTIAIEGNEVVWIDADQVGAEIRHRLLESPVINRRGVRR